MLECLVLLTLAGMVFASQRKMGLANPFQVYFFVWFLVFFGYYVFGGIFIKVSFEFLYLMLAAKAFAFLLFLIIFLAPSTQLNMRKLSRSMLNVQPEERLVLVVQIIVFCILPFVYKRAVDLAGGNDVFAIVGYTRLRYAMTEEGRGFGYFGYFFMLAFVVGSLQVNSFFKKNIGLPQLIFSLATSLIYLYFGTGRTYVLLFAALVFCPLILMKLINTKGLIISIFLIIFLFVFVATMTAKGVSVDEGISDNAESFIVNLAGYTIAPVLAFFHLTNSVMVVDLGENTFRIIYSLVYSLGLSATPPVALIREYAFVPVPTNVYTVYDVYFRDFSYLGVVIPPLFLIFHWWLYLKARRLGGAWIFYYSASIYPLLMQFFQDQYFSLLSTWIQIAFWYWLLIKKSNKEGLKKLLIYA